MNQLVLLVLVLTAFSHALKIFDNGTQQIYYEFVSDASGNQVIQFTLIQKVSGFMALGFGTALTKADLVYCYYSKSKPICKDYWASGAAAQVDTKQSLTLVSSLCSRSSSYSKYVFYRKLSTGDTKQDTKIVIGSNNFVWASSSSDSLTTSAKSGTFKAMIQKSTLIGSDKYMQMYYSWVNSTTVEIQLRSKINGYTGLGYGGTRMSGTDMTICRVNSGYECRDYTGTNNADEDSAQNVQIILPLSYSLSSYRQYTYQRKLNTGDSNDYTIQKGRQFNIIWANHDSESLNQHCSYGVGQAIFN